ncbi:MAG: Hsp70 family protein [Acidimicrobiia bacterium]
MAYELGVDLGTTFSTVAILRDGHIEMADLGAHSFAVPSVLYIGPDARVLVGEAARRRAATDPTLVVREVKRRLGDTAPMLVGDTAYSPALLTAALLRGVVSRVVRAEGGPPRRINLAHPANWGSFRREVFAEAATLAGIETEFSFIIEPVAAAVWHARHERVPTGAVVAVYDLGGGTFDAAVLRKTEESFEVLGEPLGLDRLGGIDFDEAIIGFVDRCLDGALQRLDPLAESSARIMRAVRDEVVAAKEALSTDIAATINVSLPSGLEAVRLTRRELEEMIEPLVAQSIGVLQATLELAGVEVRSLHKVLLVGGASRVPLVAELVERELGVAASLDEHPKNAIALGAAAALGPQVEPDQTAGASHREVDAPAAPGVSAEPAAPAGGGPAGPAPAGVEAAGAVPAGVEAAGAVPVGDEVGAVEVAPATVAADAAAALVLVSGPDGGALVSLVAPGSIVVGRDDGCELQLHDPRVSRRHAQLNTTVDGLTVVDLGSSNHVFVDGEQVQQAAVLDGQALRLGNTVALVAVPAQREEGHAASVATGAPPATMLFGAAAALQAELAPAPAADDDDLLAGPIDAFLLPAPAGARRRGRRIDTEEYGLELEALRPELLERRRQVAALLRRRHPAAGQGLVRRRRTVRPGDEGFLACTVGYGEVATAVPFAAPEQLGPQGQEVIDAFLAPYWYDHDVPVVVRLDGGGTCLLAGEPAPVLAVARQLVAQLVAHHDAADVAIALTSATEVGGRPLDVSPSVWARPAHLRGAEGEVLVGPVGSLQHSLDRLGPRRLVVVGDGSSLAALAVPSGTAFIELAGPAAGARPDARCTLHLDPVDGLATIDGEAARGVAGPVLPAMASALATEALLAAAR